MKTKIADISGRVWLLTFCIGLLMLWGNGFANGGASTDKRVNRENSPTEIVNTVAERANEDIKIQDTKFDTISNKGKYGKDYQMTNTLEWVRTKIQPYLQWILYIGLASATILLIWNGFRLVTNSAISWGDMKTVKGNIQSILIGVLIMSGFLVIIKVVMAIMNMFFSR